MAKHKEKPKLEYNLPHKNRKHKNASVTRRAYTYDGRGNLTGEEENGELLHGYEYGAITALQEPITAEGKEGTVYRSCTITCRMNWEARYVSVPQKVT